MSRVLVNGQDVNYTSDFPEMTYNKWKEIPENLRPNYTVITDRDYTGGEPSDNSVSITADGVKTYSQLLDELYALVDKSKISRNAKLVKTRYSDGQTLIFSLVDIVSSTYIFTYSYVYNSNDSPRESISMMSSGSKFAKVVFYTFTDNSSSVPASGDVFTLYYNTVSSGGSIEITADDVSYGIGTVEDALDDLQPTLSTVTKVGVTGELYVTMFGKIGVISGYFFNASDLSANTIIGTVPYTPLTNYVISGTSNGAIAYIDTSGNIKIANEISSLPVGAHSIGGTFVIS